MITNPLSPIGRVDLDSAARLSLPSGEGEAAISPIVTASTEANLAVPRVEPVKREDIRLKFMVDSQSKEVTVLILDRASQRVLRTIPADELSRLKEGDLIELFA
jgi:FlaG protein